MIHALEQAGPERAIVDKSLGARQAGADAAVDAASPSGTADRVKPFRMLLEEHGFSLAIAHLLLQIGLDGLATVVPHDGRWTEADAMAAFLQTPADVDIITRRRVGRIKAADLGQRMPCGTPYYSLGCARRCHRRAKCALVNQATTPRSWPANPLLAAGDSARRRRHDRCA